jgi:hypothetical protein
MIDSLTASTATEFALKYGVAGLIFIMWLLSQRAEQRRWDISRKDEAERQQKTLDSENAKREADRAEHMKKWDSMLLMQKDQFVFMVNSHAAESESTHDILKRQAAAMEMQAAQLSHLNAKIENNRFCPITRKEGPQ